MRGSSRAVVFEAPPAEPAEASDGELDDTAKDDKETPGQASKDPGRRRRKCLVTQASQPRKETRRLRLRLGPELPRRRPRRQQGSSRMSFAATGC